MSEMRDVTAFVQSLSTAPFDREQVSHKYANKHGMTQAEVLEMWEKKRQAGIVFHEYVNTVLTESERPPVITPQMRVFNDFWTYISKRWEVVEVEKGVGAESLRLKGRLDLLVSEGSDLAVVDFKPKYSTYGFNTRLKRPFSHLWASTATMVAFQVSAYRLILSEAMIMTTKGYCVEVNNSRWSLHELPDYRAQLLDYISAGN